MFFFRFTYGLTATSSDTFDKNKTQMKGKAQSLLEIIAVTVYYVFYIREYQLKIPPMERKKVYKGSKKKKKKKKKCPSNFFPHHHQQHPSQ